MALFVELDDDDVEQPPDRQATWPQDSAKESARSAIPLRAKMAHGDSLEQTLRDNPNRNSMTKALGCYPIVIALAACIDLNTLDSLSQTCRQVRVGLLQYRTMLVVSTLHCSNDDLAVDPEETLRYRVRAANWMYMEETGRAVSGGKSGHCARDMVSECRRCGTVVCRNCAIKPPAPIVLRDRHRRLCVPCTRAPLSRLVKPRLPTLTHLATSEALQQSVCKCATGGVWLCQPCGRRIRGDDHEYKGFVLATRPFFSPQLRRATHTTNRIWRWRSQYGDPFGGIGTGIGEGVRGVECGREGECISFREQEQETDCDAEDAAELGSNGGTGSGSNVSTPPQLWATPQGIGSLSNSIHSLGTPTPPPPGTSESVITGASLRTPSPALGPGYARHEIEGIGGVVKMKKVKMVRIGACVPEREDEKVRHDFMGMEVSGKVRSWCGWCKRVIPCANECED